MTEMWNGFQHLGKCWKRRKTGYLSYELCAQYALSSRVNAWDGADYELIDTLKLLMPVIDEAGKAADDMERYLATNHILLMIWKYFAEIIDEIEKNSTENEEQKPRTGRA